MDSQTDIDLEERKRKQAYLKDQILAKGYDGVKFSEYMCAIKPDGNNIDRWTFDDLMTAVLSFKKIQCDLSFQQQHLDESTMSLLQLFDRSDLNMNMNNNMSNNMNNTKLFPDLSDKQDDIYVPSMTTNLDEEGLGRNNDQSTLQKSQLQAPQASAKRSSKYLSVNPGSNSQKAKSTSPSSDARGSFIADDTRGTSNLGNTSTQAKQPTSIKHQNTITQIQITPPTANNMNNSQSLSMSESTIRTYLPPTTNTRQVMKARLLEATPLAKEKKGVSVSVTDPQQVDGGMFSSAYVQYTVSTNPLGWVVKRRFNDFFWLRSILQKFYPGAVIPPIPEKKNKKKFDMEVLRKRMYFFETFLNACLEHEDLKSDKLLYQFLNLRDEVLFKKIKEAAEKISKPAKVEDISSAKGYAVLDTNPDFNKYLQLVNIYSDQTTPIYKRIRGIAKELITTIKQASGLVLDLNKNFAALQAISNSFNKNVPPTHSVRFEGTYASLCKMMSAWGDQLTKQAHVVYKNIFCFYKYSSMENEVYKELAQFKTKNDDEFAKRVRDLVAKKDKLFMAGDVNKWEMDAERSSIIPREDLVKNKELAFSVMLQNDTKDVKQTRDFAAYLNATISSEVARAFDMRCYRYNSNFQDFINNQLSGFNRLQMGWDDLISTHSESRSRSRVHILSNKSFSNDDSTIETSAMNLSAMHNSDNTNVLKALNSRRNAK